MNSNFFNLVTRPSTRSARTLDEVFGLTNHLWSSGLPSDESPFMPSVDVQETPVYWALMLDVPGVKKDDLKIDVEGNRQTISGQRYAPVAESENKADEKWSHVERRFGSFSRSFSLPEQVETDAIRAEHKDGVLKIVIPKKPTAAKKSISIESE